MTKRRRRAEDDEDQRRYNRLLGLMTVAELKEFEQLHELDPTLPMHKWPAKRFARAVALVELAYHRLPPTEQWIVDEDEAA